MKKLISVILCFMLCLGMGNKAMAVENEECIDGSYLTNDDSSEVTVGAVSRGIYLKSGTSIINKQGTGKIGAGGDTVGQKIVSKITVVVQVERLENGRWYTYGSSWSATNYNSAYVSTSKVKTVATGYYYRVRCTHYANSDVSTSCTNGIYI
ncbi:DUF6147 family protein [Roseburia hominis]